MDIDPLFYSRRENSSSGSTEAGNAACDYPEPPSQSSAHQHPSSTASHPSRTQTSYQGSSSTLRASPHLDSTDPNDPYSDLKRPRACEACRQLKVRCEPDLVNPDGPCKRCSKASRSCIVTVPTRKRQKKTDSRVTELERKIDALTASLQASQKIEALLPSNSSAQSKSPREEHVGRRWLVSGQSSSLNRSIPSEPAPSNQAGSKRHHSGEVKDSRDTTGLSTHARTSTSSPAADSTHDTAAKQWPAPWSTPTPTPKESSSKFPDIIDRGLVSPAVALESFIRYVDAMSGHIPMVVFPPGTQMSDVRTNRPVLFHAIVAVAVGPFQPSAQHALLQELYRTIAERVIVKGEKSLDLVQALLVSCAFYTPPENFEEIKFYQLAQLAVAVGMDIGMYRKSSSKPKPFNFIKEVVKHPPLSDPDSPEVRRAWLGCYFVSVQTSTALRRPILLRWLPYMDECIEILENSPDALPSDKALIQWAKLVRIIEEISSRFFADDLGSNPSFSESKFQFTLKAFEKQLEQWRKEAFIHHNSAIMSQAEAIVSIYLHENSMVLESPSEENRNTDADISSPSTAARISALSATLASIHQAIDTICSISVKELVNIPTIALARTAFAIVALIKLYSIVTAPDSYVGQVIEPSNLKVEYYLEKVITHYTAAGELPGGVTPGKFSTVLSMLRDWFKSRKDQHVALKEALNFPRNPGGNSSASEPDRNQNNPEMPTPLQLLSEAANQTNQNQHHLQQHPPIYPSPRTSFPTTETIPQSSPELILPPCLSPPTGTTTITTTAPDTSDSWAPFQPRQFYPSPYDLNASPAQQQGAGAGTGAPTSTPGYPDLSGSTAGGIPVMPSPATQGLFIPELGIQMGYDPENFYAVWNMMGEGVLNLPMPTDGGGFF